MNPVDFGFDRSIMVNLTPSEIKNMLIDFAERFHQAKLNGTEITVDELAQAYYNMTTGILQFNDPTRFISNS
jgi:hypothetical protein